MKVAILYNLNRGKHEYETEFDLPITINALCNALRKEFDVVKVEGTKNIAYWTKKLAAERPDIVFNIAEGYKGPGREALYPIVCEQLGLLYTGPRPTELLICHNKSLTKDLVHASGVPLLWSKLINNIKDLNRLDLCSIPFPIIVKLNSEGSSLALDENCIVEDYDALLSQVEKVLKKYNDKIILEKYIKGIDLSTTYVEGMGVFGPVQYSYPEKPIYDYKLKSVDNDKVDIIKPNLERQIIEKVHSYTSTICSILNINGYARADFRLDAETGEVYLLEMNAQVCFHPNGAFILGVTLHSCYNFDDVVLHIAHYIKKEIN